ncbi:MAG: hypothetical protein IT371_31645 [Deltaproteobacteria bacterium]|nr:hypothetical protein [Deltaproteobacteria bacterium]
MLRVLPRLLVALPLLSSVAEAQPASQPASAPAVAPESASKRELDQLRREMEVLRRQIKALGRKQTETEERVAASEEALLEGADDSRREEKFSIYGFFDVSFHKTWLPSDYVYRAFTEEDPMFVFGNLNIYFDFKPIPDWRFLAEVRFLLNPIGDTFAYESAILGTQFERAHTRTRDPSAFNQNIDLGGILIERAQVEWSRIEWFNVTAGLFLTPYGLWNIDHGSPARVAANAPIIYNSLFSAMPERQLGLKLSGRIPVPGVELRYVATVSNGRGPANTLKDTDVDKAFGGRLEFSKSGKGWRLKLGASGYTGLYTDFKEVLQVLPTPELQRKTTVRYRETAVAGDLSLELGPVTFVSEAMANWRKYEDNLRPSILIGPGRGGLAADRAAWGWYGTLIYQLPIQRANLRLFSGVYFVDFNDTVAFDNLFVVSSGVNWRIGGAVSVKVQHQFWTWTRPQPSSFILFSNDEVLGFGNGAVNRVITQLAVAF